MSHTLLAVAVPEADELVRRLIRRFEPDFDLSRPNDVQAHVTVLSPFVPLEQIDDGLLADLAGFFADHPSFNYRLVDVRTFPGAVVYLAPEPTRPFLSWIDLAVRCYPNYPPYGGRFDEVIPHMTVGPCWSPEVEAELIRAAEEAAPICATATEARLFFNAPKRFETIATFSLQSER